MVSELRLCGSTSKRPLSEKLCASCAKHVCARQDQDPGFHSFIHSPRLLRYEFLCNRPSHLRPAAPCISQSPALVVAGCAGSGTGWPQTGLLCRWPAHEQKTAHWKIRIARTGCAVACALLCSNLSAKQATKQGLMHLLCT